MLPVKIAYIFSIHKNSQQFLRLLNKLNAPTNSFFVHVDKKADKEFYKSVVDNLKDYPNVYFVRRYNCTYLGFGILQATIEALSEALTTGDFDYFVNLSGLDYPIKSNAQIAAKLNLKKEFSYLWNFPLPYEGEYPGKGYISQELKRIESWHIRFRNYYFRFPYKHLRVDDNLKTFKRLPLWALSKLISQRNFLQGNKPYGGGAWWCLNRKHAEYIIKFIAGNQKFYSSFKYTYIPDEIFYHTVLMNSPFCCEIVNDDLRLFTFVKKTLSPKTIKSEDYDEIINSDQLFARKFDSQIDDQILNKIDLIT